MPKTPPLCICETVSKHMKKIIILILISCSFLQTNGQNIDKTYYLLGTLKDYCGRQYPKNNPTQWNYVIILHQSKFGEIKRIEEVTKKKFKKHRKKKGCSNCQEFYELKSYGRARKLNSFYEFEKKKGWKDQMGFTFYTGTLICDKLLNSSENQQLSFIAGLFLTSGEKKSDNYSISLFNSSDRFECAKQILLNLGAKIENEEIDNNIPNGYYLEFIPSEKIRKIIENEILRRNTLANKGS